MGSNANYHIRRLNQGGDTAVIYPTTEIVEMEWLTSSPAAAALRPYRYYYYYVVVLNLKLKLQALEHP